MKGLTFILLLAFVVAGIATAAAMWSMRCATETFSAAISDPAGLAS